MEDYFPRMRKERVQGDFLELRLLLSEKNVNVMFRISNITIIWIFKVVKRYSFVYEFY